MSNLKFHEYAIKTSFGIIQTLEAGHGTPLVFFHGWSSNAYLYLRVLETFSKKYRVILPTLPGAYPSFSWKGEVQRDRIAEALSEWFTLMRLPTSFVAGHSLGGLHAILLASRIKTQIKKLFLLDSAGVPIKRTPKEWREVWLLKRKRFIKDHGLKIVAKDFMQGFMLQLLTHRKDLIALSKVARHDDIRDIAKNLSIPTEIVWGTNDFFLPKHIGEELHKVIPRSTFVLVNGDHEWPVYHPELLMPQLTA